MLRPEFFFGTGNVNKAVVWRTACSYVLLRLFGNVKLVLLF